MCPEPRSRMCGQQADDQLDRAEVVELHRAFEVVEAVVAERDRAPDRAPGVVDEHVDVAVVGEHPLEQPVDRLDVGDVGRVHVGGAARGDDLRAHLLELLDVAGHEQRHAAGGGDLQGGRAPDARGGAGDQHVLAVERLLQRARRGRGRGPSRAPSSPTGAPAYSCSGGGCSSGEPASALLRSRACRSGARAPCARAPPRGCPARAARALRTWRQRRQRGGERAAATSAAGRSGVCRCSPRSAARARRRRAR